MTMKKQMCHLLEELGQLKHLSTKTAAYNHNKIRNATSDVKINEKNKKSDKSYIPRTFSNEVHPDNMMLH